MVETDSFIDQQFLTIFILIKIIKYKVGEHFGEH